jgi:zinc protease
MRCSKLFLVAAAGAAALLFINSARAADEKPWPVVAEGLAPDPAWRWGRLPNGLRYVVRENALPAGRLSYRLAVEVGAAHEAPNERGFAHLVEHLAFNGTRRFPGEKLQHEMKARGLAFGPEVSAFTFPTHTIYQFDAPGAVESDLTWMLSVLRDFADGVAFEPREVKRELGVIDAELRDRASPGQRLDRARRAELYPASPLGLPVDARPTGATADRLRAFYQKWYRPDRMVLVVVGDASADDLEAAVRREFATLSAPAGAAPPFSPGPIENPAQTTVQFARDDEAGGLWLEFTSVLPVVAPASATERRRALASSLATQALELRLGEIARGQPQTFAELGVRLQATTPFVYETNVFAAALPSEWKTVLATLDTELRRSLDYPLPATELARAKTRILRSAELAVNSARTAESPMLAAWAMQEAVWGVAAVSPEENLRYVRETLPTLEPLEVAQAWRSFWQANRLRVFGYGYFPSPQPGVDLSQALAARSQEKIPPPVERAAVAFPYTDFGPAGTVVTHRHDPEVDVHLLEFANGVRVNLKRTTFEANRIDLGVALGAGLQHAPRDRAALPAFASTMLLNGGLGKMPPGDLLHLLDTEPLTLSFSCTEGAFHFGGTAPPDRLELLLQLLCAYLTDPGWDANAFAGAGAQLKNNFGDLSRTSEGLLRLGVFPTLTRADARYRTPTIAEIMQTELDDVRRWLAPILRDEPIEVGIVGDLQPDALLPLLARTLGALPPRAGASAPRQPVEFSKAPQEFFFLAPPNPRAAVNVLWPADQGATIGGSRRLEVLSAILHNRINQKIREDLGAAYAPDVDYWRSESGSDEGYISAFVTTAPKLADKVRKLVLAEADTLARRGVTPAEFQEALAPILQRTRLQLTANDYWLWNITIKAQRRPEVLTWPLTRTSEFERITPAEISALAAAVLPRAKAQQFTASPLPR